MNNDDKVLHMLKDSGALLEGHFLLSSGLHSGRYVQCALALANTGYAASLGELLALKCRDIKFDTVVSPAMGGIIIGHEVARYLKLPFLFTERVENVMSLRRGFQIESGKNYLIVEDVVTTGKSSLEVAEVIKSLGGNIAGYASIVDRRMNDKTDLVLQSLVKLTIESYEPAQCPMCQKGIAVVKPGSRKQ